MTKEELVAHLASEAGITRAAAEKTLNAFTNLVLDRAAEGLDTPVHKFGTFSRKDRAARKGRNPQSGKQIDLPAVSVLAFKPSKTTRDHLA